MCWQWHPQLYRAPKALAKSRGAAHTPLDKTTIMYQCCISPPPSLISSYSPAGKGKRIIVLWLCRGTIHFKTYSLSVRESVLFFLCMCAFFIYLGQYFAEILIQHCNLSPRSHVPDEARLFVDAEHASKCLLTCDAVIRYAFTFTKPPNGCKGFSKRLLSRFLYFLAFCVSLNSL